MTDAAKTITVVDVPDHPTQSRFEARRPDGTVLGFTAYRRRGERVVFTHTEVDPDTKGQGVGSALARGALDALRPEGAVVVPLCPFIKAFIRRNEEFHAQLAPDTEV